MKMQKRNCRKIKFTFLVIHNKYTLLTRRSSGSYFKSKFGVCTTEKVWNSRESQRISSRWISSSSCAFSLSVALHHRFYSFLLRKYFVCLSCRKDEQFNFELSSASFWLCLLWFRLLSAGKDEKYLKLSLSRC